MGAIWIKNDIALAASRSAVGMLYRHPIELAYHALFSIEEKLEMLEAWSRSDNAVKNVSYMRRDPSSGRLAHIDELAVALEATREQNCSAPVRPALAKRPIAALERTAA